jgi:hypothetical protein
MVCNQARLQFDGGQPAVTNANRQSENRPPGDFPTGCLHNAHSLPKLGHHDGRRQVGAFRCQYFDLRRQHQMGFL